ncbi:unnamed protein product [Linum trigynum]|uniref:Uncharacterized protein n=1 Tax=Linum trigynum TaxID=586398 RepID=A0AAV2CHK2_9ROSI
MDAKIISIRTIGKDRNEIDMVSSQNEGSKTPKKVVCYQNEAKIQSSPTANVAPLIIKTSGPFKYEDPKAVPWVYTCQLNQEVSTPPYEAANITGIGGITRSGRHYVPEDVEKRRIEELTKRQEIKRGKQKVMEALNPEIAEESEDILKMKEPEEYEPQVSDEDACEFLKLIKQSEFKVVEQLNRMPARISLLSLILTSEPHRKALMKVLNQAHVCHNVSIDKWDGIVGAVLTNVKISFNEDEIPAEGTGHTKALHISLKCKGHMIARALIDNGSALNVMPKSTLNQLPIDESYIKPSFIVVRAFDGTKRKVIGEIELPIQIGPTVFNIVFQVMDINPSYSLLLGRPWIHSAGAVPSSLHQKVKFVVDGNLIEVFGKEDILVTKTPDAPYIEAAEEAIESAFQSLEIEDVTYVGRGSKLRKQIFVATSIMATKSMIKWVDKEMWTTLIRPPLKIRENKNRCGLGYSPNKGDIRRIHE